MATSLLTRERRAPGDRETTAERLLASSARQSFDPRVEVDWASPHVAGMPFTPLERTPLYGTSLWEEMSPEQHIDLTRHVVASIASAGVWFETILSQMLYRHLYGQDPRSRHFQFGLTEIADECRHSIMFGDLVSWLDCPDYTPERWLLELGKVMSTPVCNDSVAFAGTYYVEAILDALQREAAADESVQPVVRRVSEIHVIEEARHMKYADEELARDLADMGRVEREWTRVFLPAVCAMATKSLIHPDVYANVGLDPQEAQRAAAGNPNWRATLRWAAEKPFRVYRSLGLMDGVGAVAWRATGLL